MLGGLLKDNSDFISGRSVPQTQLSSAGVRHEVAEYGQKPVVAIVCCADSRVGPEIIFGAGVGKLFVIRNAGNIVTETSVLASLEFAVNSLHVPLIMVIGHSKCGAITAAVDVAKAKAKQSGSSKSGSSGSDSEDTEDTEDDEAADYKDVADLNLSPLAQYVTDLSQVVKTDAGKPNDVDRGTVTNIRHGVKSLKFEAGPVTEAYRDGKIDIVGALYDIHSGKVSLVDQ